MMSTGTDGWISAIEEIELPQDRAVRVELNGTDVLLVRGVEGTILAVDARCTHQGAPLDRGVLHLRDAEPTVTCPAHGSVFSLASGRVRRGPATRPVQAYETRVSEGHVEVRPTTA
jgi:nitrite reductase/ring-hydroxylating ferredoxin subunit